VFLVYITAVNYHQYCYLLDDAEVMESASIARLRGKMQLMLSKHKQKRRQKWIKGGIKFTQVSE
jgi:hypothetical protein